MLVGFKRWPSVTHGIWIANLGCSQSCHVLGAWLLIPCLFTNSKLVLRGVRLLIWSLWFLAFCFLF